MRGWLVFCFSFGAIGVALAAGACSTSPDTTPAPDGGVDATTDGGFDAGPDVRNPVDTGADDAGPIVAIADTVSLPGVPQRMAFNSATNRLYVMLSSTGTVPGIVAIDTTNDQVIGTLTASTDAGAPVFFDNVAVDSSANVVYGALYRTIYAFGGATGALSDTIDLRPGLADAGAGGIYGLAVDPGGKKLYALVGAATGAQTVVVVDTSAAPPTVGPTVALADLVPNADPFGDALVLDPQKHLLFACGIGSAGANAPAAADTIDTTTNLVTGSQQQFIGASLGCKATPGFAALVTQASSAQIHALEPSNVALPDGYNWTSFSVGPETLSHTTTMVTAFGVASGTGQVSAFFFSFCGERPVRAAGRTSLATTDMLVNGVISGTSFANAQDIWITERPQNLANDAGAAAPSQIYKLHVDQALLPPPPDDAGCQ